MKMDGDKLRAVAQLVDYLKATDAKVQQGHWTPQGRWDYDWPLKKSVRNQEDAEEKVAGVADLVNYNNKKGFVKAPT